MLRRMFSTFAKQQMKPLPIEILFENNKIKDIKIFPELIGKDIRELQHYPLTNIYYITTWEFEEMMKKHINKNIPLL